MTQQRTRNYETKPSYLQLNILEKGKWICYCLLIFLLVITPIDWSCYRVINWSILQETFIHFKKFIIQCRKNIIKKEIDITYDISCVRRLTRNKNLSIVVWSCCSKRFFCGIYSFTIILCPSLMMGRY